MISMHSYYVYELCFPDTGKPFYVGKGSDDGSRTFKRANCHWKKHQLVRILIRAMRARGEKPTVKIVFESISEDSAFSEEIRRIKYYGRRFDGGLLWNVSDGGFGGTPRGRPLSPEHKAKIGAANYGKRRSPEQKERIAKAVSERTLSVKQLEHLRRLADSRRGIPRSEEIKHKCADAQRGIPRGPHSPATRLLMSTSAKTGWEKRRLRLSA